MIRAGIVVVGLLFVWQLAVMLFNLPPYILPTPIEVIRIWYLQYHLILREAVPTIVEALTGLALGTLFGMLSALVLDYCKPARLWFLPVLLISQALPTFAIAPILVVWFGYGMASKIVTTVIMLFFPVTNAFYDGLLRTPLGRMDLAKILSGGNRWAKWRVLWHIKLPSALPSLATGIRVATAIAPIGAVVGEWVGAGKGLGFLMLNANARMQIDLMFAALFTITLFTLILYFSVDKFLKVVIPWEHEV